MPIHERHTDEGWSCALSEPLLSSLSDGQLLNDFESDPLAPVTLGQVQGDAHARASALCRLTDMLTSTPQEGLRDL